MNWPGFQLGPSPWDEKRMADWTAEDINKAIDWNVRRKRLDRLRSWLLVALLAFGVAALAIACRGMIRA